ncbi:hypothetical protein KUCAC02_023125 [Chaenocephalus aceratus]|uniref:Uncharacterized protein n=1 Tax=Chaenocephalus aceratus TaxID=36190 RepID=A0ACB9XQL8_CHAAC|nr:hypothetical protein KUCAC02_023125 [Chaenocephalus aceratus]
MHFNGLLEDARPAPERPAPERPAPERPAPVRPASSQAGTPHLASPSSRSEHLEATQDFTHNTILLLLDLTKTHQQVYYHSKPGFYKILQRQFSKEGFSFSSDKIREKLNNLLTTYKRAKDRCTSTGEGNITWEYYGIMDNLFGRCGVGSAPPGTLVSTPLFPTASQPSTTLPCASEAQPGPSMTLPTTLPCASEAQPGSSMTLPTTLPCASEAQPGPSMTLPTTLPCASEGQPGPSMTLPTTLPCASEGQPGPSMTLPTTLPCASEGQPGPSMTLPTTLPCASEGQPGPSMTLPTTLPCASEAQPGPSMTLPTTQPRSIRSRVSHPSFYDLYEAHSERRTSALETLVRPEQERRRRLKERNRRFEANMLTAMGEVVSQLKSIGSQQERIIELLQDKPNMP